MSQKIIKTRFAPSPTGFLHVGGLRTALYAYLIAKKHEQGIFALRIEDTDQGRLVEGAIENIVQTLHWAHIPIDEGVDLTDDAQITQKGTQGPYIQSERLDIYKKHVQQLIDSGAAYYAFDSSEELTKMRELQQIQKKATHYDRMNMTNECTIGREETQKRIAQGDAYVIRLKVPEDRIITFTDKIRGTISVHTKEVDDQILLKSDGFPTYHLAVVVDDHTMGVTDVIRGEEWISSTPKHILLYEAFGWEPTTFAHLPLLVNESKQKLSKRHGDVAVEDFKAKGYLPEALVNFIAFLGWNPGTDQEIFSLNELIEAFDISRISKSSAVFNREKLDWYNAQYIKMLSPEDLFERALPFLVNAGLMSNQEALAQKQWILQALALEQSRAHTLVELVDAVQFIFATDLMYDSALLVWKKSTHEDAKAKLTELHAFLEKIDTENWNLEHISSEVKQWIETQGYQNGDVLWPLRVALSGRKNSPGPFEIAAVLQKEKTCTRIQAAIALL